MRIIGIDPGFAIVGYGIIEREGNKIMPLEYGVIETSAELPQTDRLQYIYRQLNSIIQKYNPTEAAIEELFFNKNTKTAIKVAQARGVEILACTNNDIKVYEYTPLQIKQAVVGYGRAEKHQVQEMIKILLNLSSIPKPDDAADALSIAYTHSTTGNQKDIFLMR